MANETEHFDYEAVIEKMKALENLFDDFRKNINELNKYIDENINNSADSCIYGQLGTRLVKFWDENSLTFDQFYNNFRRWSNAVVQQCFDNYLTFEEETAAKGA